jgi:hypothetical protein
MDVERFMRGKLARYRIHSDYDGDAIAVEPKELLALLTWLQEHEQEIINDQTANMAYEAVQYDPAILDERNPFSDPPML